MYCTKTLYHPLIGRFVGVRPGTVQHTCSTAGAHPLYAVVGSAIRRERRRQRRAARYPDECYYERGRFLPVIFEIKRGCFFTVSPDLKDA